MNTNPTPAANAAPARREPCDLHPERPAVRTRRGLTTPSDPGAARVVVLHYCAECAEEHDYYEALAAEDDEDDEDDSAAPTTMTGPMTATSLDLTSLPADELERWADGLHSLADELAGEPRRAALADALACEREIARRREDERALRNAA